MPLTVAEFVIRWKAYDQSEEAGAKPLFFDLCDLLRQPHPAAADSAGENYASKSASAKPAEPKDSPTSGRDHFAWKYKKKRKLTPSSTMIAKSSATRRSLLSATSSVSKSTLTTPACQG